MSSSLGTRTSPTVKSSPLMNRRSLSTWEMKLSLTHVVVLVGLVTGSMVCAFSFGFFSGQRSGFESAMTASVPSVPRLPTDDTESSSRRDARDDFASSVYARLNQERSVDDPDHAGEPLAMPALQGIKSASEAPVVLPSVETSESVEASDGTTMGTLGGVVEQDHVQADDELLQEIESSSGASVSINDKGLSPSQATLGALLAKEAGVVQPVKEAPTTRELSEQKKVLTRAQVAEPKREDLTLDRKAQAIDPVSKAPVINSLKDVTKQTRGTKPETKRNPGERLPASNESARARALVDKEVAVAVKKPAGLIRTVVPAGWYAQVSAPTRVEDADGLAKKLKDSGFPVLVEHAQVRGEQYFRVLVGPEEGRKQGQILVDQLKKERYIRGEPFLRLVR